MTDPRPHDQRARVLGKVRAALDAGAKAGWLPQPVPPLPVIDEAFVRECDHQPAAALRERFIARIAKLGDMALCVDDAAAARRMLEDLAGEKDWKLGAIDADAAAYLGTSPTLGTAVLRQAGDKALAFDADVGITLVDAAVAETGSLAIAVRPGRARLTSLAPTTHIAVLPIDRLLPDVYDLLRLQAADAEPSGWTWITGSSRTADIDGILIQGAHGPAHLIVLIVGIA